MIVYSPFNSFGRSYKQLQKRLYTIKALEDTPVTKQSKQTQIKPIPKQEIQKPKVQESTPEPPQRLKPPVVRKTQIAPPEQMTQEVAKPKMKNKQKIISAIQQKYSGVKPGLLKTISESVPEPAIEWVVRSVQDRLGTRSEDIPKYISAYNYAKQNLGNQAFVNAIKQKNPDVNLKDILSFKFDDIEDVRDQLTQTPQKSKRAEKKEAKVEGASEYYRDDKWKIVQVGGPGVDLNQASKAACLYAKGTRWCTADPDVNKKYLMESPLYVLFDKNVDRYEKVGQFDLISGQLKDPKDDDIPITPRIVEMLKKSGLFGKYWENNNFEKLFSAMTGGIPLSEDRNLQDEAHKILLDDPKALYKSLRTRHLEEHYEGRNNEITEDISIFLSFVANLLGISTNEAKEYLSQNKVMRVIMRLGSKKLGVEYPAEWEDDFDETDGPYWTWPI